ADRGPPAAPLLEWDDIRQLHGAGWEIGGHSATHRRLPGLSTAELDYEVRASRRTIERQLERPIRWFAYPFGDHDMGVRQATRGAGYDLAFTFEGGLAGACDDVMLMPRIPVSESDGVFGLAAKIATGDDAWTALKR